MTITILAAIFRLYVATPPNMQISISLVLAMAAAFAQPSLQQN